MITILIKFNFIYLTVFKVGDVVRLQCDEVIPADLLLLHTSSVSGVCYVETANLDGETNLKQRTLFYERTESFDIKTFTAPILCEQVRNRREIERYHITSHFVY